MLIVACCSFQAKRDVQVGNDRKYGIVFDVDVNDLGKRRPA